METAAGKHGRRNAGKEQYWRGVVEAQGASGKTVLGFCREKGLNANSFYGWRRELRLRDSAKAAGDGFVELVRGGGPTGSAGISLRVDGRVSIVLERGFDGATLKAVLAGVLGAAGQ